MSDLITAEVLEASFFFGSIFFDTPSATPPKESDYTMKKHLFSSNTLLTLRGTHINMTPKQP